MARQQIANLNNAGSNPVTHSNYFYQGTKMTPTKTFKLSKTTKRRMATMANATERNDYKAAMIRAELAASVTVRSSKDRENNK